jgi:hypothetical protein
MTPELKAKFEQWLVSDSEVKRRHARFRLEQNLGSSKSNSSVPIPLPESLVLLRLVNSCPYRSRDAACGCSGHRCALRLTSPIVSHLNCLDCVRCYG